MSPPNKSFEMMEVIAQGLGDLLGRVVFIGGATTSCYIDNPAAHSIRPTEDVDCVVSIAKRTEYYTFEEELRRHGFSHVVEPGAPLCRWQYENVKVDIMPDDPGILGFSNMWYKVGIDSSIKTSLPSGGEISIFTFPLFIATKMEAYKNRGESDPRFSQDVEDIVLVLDGQNDISRLYDATDEVCRYLQREFRTLLADERFTESIPGYIGYSTTGVERAQLILGFLRKYAGE
jgi:hypothetical protein